MTPQHIETRLADLQAHPQTWRLWRRNVRFGRFLQRWHNWQSLVASRALPPGQLRMLGRQLEQEWAEVESFFARFEADRRRVDGLHKNLEQLRAARTTEDLTRLKRSIRELDREWTKLETADHYSGDPGSFAAFEDLLTGVEEQAQRRLAAAREENKEAPASPAASPPPGHARMEAQRLLRASAAIIETARLSEKTRASLAQDRRHILDLLDNGESVCAFWWAKDLHTWLVTVAEDQKLAPAFSPAAVAGRIAQTHTRFNAIQTELAKLLRG